MNRIRIQVLTFVSPALYHGAIPLSYDIQLTPVDSRSGPILPNAKIGNNNCIVGLWLAYLQDSPLRQRMASNHDNLGFNSGQLPL